MGKQIFISGGGGGIGRALCRRLVAAGDHPIIGYRTLSPSLTAFCDELNIPCVALDFDQENAAMTAITALDALECQLDGIVFAASPPPVVGPFGAITELDMLTQWRANVLGPQAFLGQVLKCDFRKRKSGFVLAILTKALADEQSPGMGQMGAYVIAKSGLVGVLSAAKAEFPWLNIASIRPGFTETSMLEVFDARYLDAMREKDPRGRFSTPDEVAEDLFALIGDLE